MELDEVIAQINQEVSYSEEKQLLLHGLSLRIIKILIKHKAFIAGGAITSIFSNKDIKDYDVFFRNEESFKAVESEFRAMGSKYAKTNNANTYKNLDSTNTTIQLIKLPDSFKANPKDIFNEFDFTACCGLYDFTEDRFYLHRDFLKHLSQRKLIFNTAHRFPISSLLRSEKYKLKGFTIDSVNHLKIVMCIGALNIRTNADAAKQLQGMYFGENKTAFTDLLTDETPFDLIKFFQVVEPMQEDPFMPKKVLYTTPIPMEPEELPF